MSQSTSRNSFISFSEELDPSVIPMDDSCIDNNQSTAEQNQKYFVDIIRDELQKDFNNDEKRGRSGISGFFREKPTEKLLHLAKTSLKIRKKRKFNRQMSHVEHCCGRDVRKKLNFNEDDNGDEKEVNTTAPSNIFRSKWQPFVKKISRISSFILRVKNSEGNKENAADDASKEHAKKSNVQCDPGDNSGLMLQKSSGDGEAAPVETYLSFQSDLDDDFLQYCSQNSQDSAGKVDSSTGSELISQAVGAYEEMQLD